MGKDKVNNLHRHPLTLTLSSPFLVGVGRKKKPPDATPSVDPLPPSVQSLSFFDESVDCPRGDHTSLLPSCASRPPLSPLSSNQMSFQALGVSASFLVSLRSRVSNPSWTTRDICDNIVVPETQGRRCAYIDLLKGAVDAAGRPLVAPATVFVSHAWKYPFDAPFSVMMEHARDNPDAYFWFDLFVNNQNIASDLPQEWWSTTFRS